MRGRGIRGLVTADPLGYITYQTAATSAFLSNELEIDVLNTGVGTVFWTASVTGTASVNAYIRAEIWHMSGIGDTWYLHSTAIQNTTVDANNGTKVVNKSYYISKFAPYIRLRLAVGTADGVSGAQVPTSAGAAVSATIKTHFSYREDV